MKKSYFQTTMDKLSSEKEENIQKLIKLPLEQLQERRKELYTLHKEAGECGYKEACEVNYYKYLILDEAIEVKKGNEEQTSVYLTKK